MPDPLYDNPRSPSADKYQTKLNDRDEGEYREWAKDQSEKAGRNIESDDYDMRGYWKDPKSKQGENGHYPDTYKKPSHPTFSNESKYHGVDGNEGGQWAKKNGKWTFKPGKTNIQNGLDNTRAYLKESDPDVTLLDGDD